MKVVVSEKSSIERELEVSVESSKLTQSWDKHLRNVIRQVAIPGFRRGKAPAALVERYANREELQRTVFEEVGVPAYRAAIEQEQLSPLGEPNVQLVQFEKGKDLVFKALIEIRPEVTVDEAEYSGLEVEVAKLEITDAEVGHVLDDFQQKATRTVSVDESRGLETGDIAVVDFDATHDGQPVPNGNGTDFQMKIDDSLFVPGFAEKLHGLKADEKREFEFDFPAEYGNASLAGRTIHFRFTLKGIKKQEVPALDDDFAREVSSFASLDELKADIRERLVRNLELEAGHHAVRQLAEKKTEVPVPRAFSNNVIMQTLENQARQLAQMGIQFEDFLRRQNIEPSSLVERMRPSAEVSARGEMILESIMRALEISVSDADLDAEIKRFAESQQRDEADVRAELEKQGHVEAFRADLARQRTLRAIALKTRWVLPKTEEEPAPAAAEPEAEASAADEGGDKPEKAAKAEAKPRKSRAKAAATAEE